MLADCGFVVTETPAGDTRGVFRARVDRAGDGAATGLFIWAMRALAAGLFVFGNTMILLRAAKVTMPLYSTDEYIHWANARFFAAGLAPEQFDPNLPRVNNFLYFLVVQWLARSPEGPAAMRLLNYMFIALSALFVWRLSRAFVSTTPALLAASFVFAFGYTTYGVAVIPEMMFMCTVLGLALFMARAWAPRRLVASFVAGSVAGALMMIKPHGAAIFLSTAATMAVAPVVLRRRAGAVLAAVPDLVAVAVGAAAAIILIAFVTKGALVFSPAVFVGDFYASMLSHRGGGLSLAALVDMARYFLANGVVLLTFFAPAVIVAPLLLLLLLRSPSAAENEIAAFRSFLVLTAFALLSALALFAMVSIFTHTVGAAEASEGDRIHGRYWGYLIPLFVVVTLAHFELQNRTRELRPRASMWVERAGGAVWLAAIFAFVVAVTPTFRLFPWDFPDLFALYRQNDPNWPYAAWMPSSSIIVISLLTVCAIAYLFALFALPMRRLLTAASLAATFAIGSINSTGWQLDVAPGMRTLADAGQAAARIVGRESEGLFVASEYGGLEQYVMFQLPLRSHVTIKPPSTILTEADVPPSAQWVLTMKPYPVQFRHSKAISLATLTLYLRGTDQ
jgi:hypothetical protein